MARSASVVGRQLDLFCEEIRRDPYPCYRYLRDKHPIAFFESIGWYAVTRRSDVERVLRRPGEFSSTIMRSADRALLGQDPPAHTRVRRMVSREFDMTRSRALEAWIGVAARALVRGFVRAGGGDFVRDIAQELPLRIIARFLAIDEDRLTDFKDWSQAVILGASRMIPTGQEAEIARRAHDFDRYFDDVIRCRRAQPGKDIVSAILQQPEARELADDDVRSLAKLLLIAGNETTTNLMSNAMLAMFATPGLQERLREDSSLCRAWVEETLRFDAPVQVVLRRTQLDLVLDGAHIPKNQVVAAFLGSANRDERHHPDPDGFRLERAEPHLAFGAGPHFCLGASLARLAATIGLSILIGETRRIESTESLAEVPRISALQLRGPRRLRVAVS